MNDAQLVVFAPTYSAALRACAERMVHRSEAIFIVGLEDLRRLDGLHGAVHLLLVDGGAREIVTTVEFDTLYRPHLDVRVIETTPADV